MKARLIAEGRWPHYCTLREALKPILFDAGVSDPKKFAMDVASFAFPPLDGSPHEVELTEQLLEMLKAVNINPYDNRNIVVKIPDGPSACPNFDYQYRAYKGDKLDETTALKKLVGEGAEPPPQEPFLDGTTWAPSWVPEETKHEVSAEPSSEPPPEVQIIAPPPFPDQGNGFVDWTGGLSKTASAIAADQFAKRKAFTSLFERIDRKRRCKPYDMVQWIFEYAGINPEIIDPEEVPSAGALKYLQRVQENPSCYDDFMKTVYPKIIPDKKQLEHESKQREDGSHQLNLLDAFDEEFKKSQTVA